MLKGRLKGPVYLTSSKNLLPDLLVDLRGQVNVRPARRDQLSKDGRLKTVFRKMPDVAVDKFVLTMKGGRPRAPGQFGEPLRQAAGPASST